MNCKSENTGNQPETTLKCRIESLGKLELTAFCSYLGLNGANFYTVRDKLMYNCRNFRRWEVVGIENMIHEFMPDYDGTPEDFFNQLEEKVRFVQFMNEEGGMSRATCYTRFKVFNFKKWELIGLNGLLDLFLKEHTGKEA